MCSHEKNESIWKELKEKVKGAIKKNKKKISYIIWQLGKREWHRVEDRKKVFEKKLREVKKGKISREEYVRKRKEYKAWCEEGKKKYEAEEKKKIVEY